MSVNVTTAKKSTRMDVRKITTMGMLVALGVVAVALVEVPIFPAAPFLKYDPADIPILIGTLIYGPGAGLILTVLVSFIQSFMIHGSSGIVGFFMHVVATGAMALVAGLMYQKGSPTRSRAALSLSLGAATMVVCMVGMNLIVTPIFMGAPVEAVLSMLVPVIIPFNIIKAGLNSIIALLVYQYVEHMVSRN